MKHLCVALSVCITSAFTIPLSHAATWRPVSLTVDNMQDSAPPHSTYAYPAANFTDGTFVSTNFQNPRGPDTFILSHQPNITSSPAFLGESRTVISFVKLNDTWAKAPSVDTTAQTIDVSSIFAEGQSGVYDCEVAPGGNYCMSMDPRAPLVTPKLVWAGMMGWDFGPLDAVPYVLNSDGTYSATWNAVNSRHSGYDGFGNDRVVLTFSAVTPVPEPYPVALFAVGTTILFGLGRRYRAPISA